MNNYSDLILELVDIRDVAKAYGIEFNRHGFALCPFHSEKTASFKRWNKGFAHCFGCGKTVSTVSMVKELFGITQFEAICKINEDFKLGFPIGKRQTLRQRVDSQRRVKAIRDRTHYLKMEQDKWDRRYHFLMDEWCKYDRIIRQNKPSCIEEITDEYAFALHKIKEIEYELDGMPKRPDEGGC